MARAKSEFKRIRARETPEDIIRKMRSEAVSRKPLDEVMGDYATRLEEAMSRHDKRLLNNKRIYQTKFAVGENVWCKVMGHRPYYIVKTKIREVQVGRRPSGTKNSFETKALYYLAVNLGVWKRDDEIFKTKKECIASLPETCKMCEDGEHFTDSRI